MNSLILSIGITVGALVVGSVLGYYARQTIARKQAGTIEAKLNKLITDAKTQAKETLLRGQEKYNKILEEIKEREKESQIHFTKTEERMERRERNLEQRVGEIEKQDFLLKTKVQKIRKIKDELEDLRQTQFKKLEEVAKLSQDQAREELLALAEKEHQDVLWERIVRLKREGEAELNKKAQEIIALAIQRYASSVASEITSTTVNLPSDELKGRIIGKEGRNIKVLERLTGVEILVDDTPGAVVVSAFDPVRRQIAKMTLDKLLLDGRIQPARIEETVEKAKEEIGRKIQEAGEAAVYDTGVAGLDPRLIKLLGRLRFRTSYGQNVLLHSLEVAHLAAAIAAELGADTVLTKKAGLLHDIGKAVDHEIQGSHVEIGRNILKKFNVDEKVITAMQAHHEEYPYETLESIIVQVADAISGARPGARKDTLEAYLKRLEELENIANSFAGVEKSYAIQAGREVRVFVKPEEIDDLGAYKLAKEIANKIHDDLKYPGEIKVNLIRETRVVEYAR
ncbi:MAG: ribonuclease Y [Candidatus Portnoybacteria bacterium RIFCSPLOWO2_12_FULL_39_9]|uniref:Ribonuclease Y n=1 Tax=Candidatus Portnoybacteria bacterium RIFCSPHIGHO2_12_FULL_38_9 TaxID=1801997 RepID=A0A1G2FF67_9BACT|nr:MAG: ribonuclease Y [Candidatus Portnoybacteria bacterium RIFCSPHIGHO2_02_FULL_39_12]OGZ36447.1 MAG: ribonuclease Y [Candidatus Portnoybacteria bacterium RIFCSPHIGHO2_12_FULL_38_9]OGZ38142.1 MAG: ribonuclease Y [Candidatus Portnoybacteria bacterium RIFCSPLOWO2_01_FULL_38_39]OGZ40260.1 MAG: ribonuclease Y [Candidatus Portnoybacteria bacterium RIFCSPLOWO2_12_FULL_39_9]